MKLDGTNSKKNLRVGFCHQAAPDDVADLATLNSGPTFGGALHGMQSYAHPVTIQTDPSQWSLKVKASLAKLLDDIVLVFEHSAK